MKASQFIVKSVSTESGQQIDTQFVCPKCEGADVSIMWVHAADRLLIICRRCGYQQSRATLDDCPGLEEPPDESNAV